MRANWREGTMVRIRLRRIGRKNAPLYRIVVAESTSPRDGRFIEVIGQYSPREAGPEGKGRLSVVHERANHWLDVGAQPSDTVRSLLRRAGVYSERHGERVALRKASGAVPVKETRDEG
jgi:small subunit ribosomal protein S16